MAKDPKLYDALNTKFGREQHCPKCGGHNPSGKKLPDECVWCGMFAELPKADLSKGWDTPQASPGKHEKKCLGCLGKSVHHTCGREPDAKGGE